VDVGLRRALEIALGRLVTILEKQAERNICRGRSAQAIEGKK
jgi:hypothetical protein